MSQRKVALITGASAGIGKASGLALARAGWDLALTGRRKDLLEAVAAEARTFGARAIGVACDVGQPDSVKALFDSVMAEFGHLHLLFNNAGVGAPPINMEDLTYAQWQAVVDTNLTGPFLCTQHAFRIMRDQNPIGGRIINNGSISAHAPRPNSAPYTSTKHAITGLTKSTALDGRKYNIACGQIDIGNAATPLTDRMREGAGVLQPSGQTMMEPRMDPDHAGSAVAYMASLPLDANVLFMTVMATKMPYVGRG